VDRVGPWHYPTHALNTLPDIADLPIGGLDWSDMAQEADSYPCHPALDALKPLLRMGLPYTGREGSKFWKFKKESLMVTTHPIKKHKKLDGILRQIMWRCQARVNVRVKKLSAALRERSTASLSNPSASMAFLPTAAA
jgi:hypothetical protein